MAEGARCARVAAGAGDIEMKSKKSKIMKKVPVGKSRKEQMVPAYAKMPKPKAVR